MERAQEKRRALRTGLESSGVVVTVGAHDALTARLIEIYGFDAVWVSGLGVSTMAHALPDLNLLTMTEALAAAGRIDAATGLPVVADCDNGFGGYNGWWRTVESASVSRIVPNAGNLTVGYTVDYVMKNGSHSTEQVILQLERQDDRYLIAGEA